MSRLGTVCGLALAGLFLFAGTATAQERPARSGWRYGGEDWEETPRDRDWEYEGEFDAPEREDWRYRGESWERPASPAPPGIDRALDPWSRESIELTPYFSGWFFSEEQEMLSDVGTGVRITWNPDAERGTVGLALDAGWARLRHETIDPSTGRFERTEGNLNYGLLWIELRPRVRIGSPTMGYINPWIGLGGGAFYYSSLDHAIEEVAPTAAVGTGLDWKVAEGLRLEFGYRLHLPYTRLGKGYNSLSPTSELSAGAEFWF